MSRYNVSSNLTRLILTDHGEARRAGRSPPSILRHAGPVPFVLDRDGGHVDAVEVSLVDEGESRTGVYLLGISVPSDLEFKKKDTVARFKRWRVDVNDLVEIIKDRLNGKCFSIFEVYLIYEKKE